MKKQHIADVAAEEAMITAIRGADHFLASLFVGAGQYEKERAPTVKQALGIGRRMVELRKARTRPLYFAVSKDGAATYLTPALIRRLTGWEV